MLSFDAQGSSAAPPEAVWKLLYDPSRFPEWWEGLAAVDVTDPGSAYNKYQASDPDVPMPQALNSSVEDGTVRISCLVSDLRFEWHLSALDGGAGTGISVHVEIPDSQAHHLVPQREVITRSVARLAALAADA